MRALLAFAFGRIDSPSASHAFGAGPSLSRKGRGGFHATNPSGFSIRLFTALISSAPSAPSMAR